MDDGDGIIDEDFAGYTFPLRVGTELPTQFSGFGGQFIHQTSNFNIINEGYNAEIWFPLGFMNLAIRAIPASLSLPHTMMTVTARSMKTELPCQSRLYLLLL